MTEPTLASSLSEAWLRRAQRARSDYMAAQTAPALFTPEWTARAEAEFTAAMRHAEAATR